MKNMTMNTLFNHLIIYIYGKKTNNQHAKRRK